MSASESACISEMCSRPVPKGKVRYWVDDQQGGGWFEDLTPEEADRRDREYE